MGPRRLPAGGRIDRAAPLAFSFNRRVLQGYRGDTVASALLANGVDVVARSFKYRRPRGIVGSGAAEPSALVQLGAGARALPSRLATQTELGEGLRVSSVAGWPSVERDLLSVAGLAARFLPAGFYYKTFMWPRGRWETYEGLIRRLAGFGAAPHGPDPDRYDKVNAHCDVLVVGGGPAGLAAALAASRQGARVVLADEQPELGGRLLDEPAEIDARPALAWVADATAELSRRPDVRLLTRATAFGAYADNFVAIRERPPAHRPNDAGGQLGQRLWHIAAREIVLAAGALERPLVFPNNDRPGVMLASAVSTYVNRYAVAPGAHALVFTNNDHAYRAALDLSAAGTHVVVVDVRPNPDGPLPGQARELGITILGGHVVVDVKGRGRVAGADVMRVDSSAVGVAGSRRRIACDLVAVSGGWTPTLHLHAQTGGDLGWDPSIAAFTPVRAAGQPVSVGACNGAFALEACLSQGFDAGRAAARAAGFDGAPHGPLPIAHDTPERPLLPLWIAPAPRSITRGPKQFVDLQEDVTAADLALAVREGFESIEHVKRYTTLGMGPDQGKLANLNAIGIIAGLLGRPIPDVGVTKYRPPYTPVRFGVLAGRDVGPLFDPVRKSPLHAWHESAGARFEDAGQWRRAHYYPQPGERMAEAVARECRAVRSGVGILDYSTLGKIEVVGPDAADFLNRVYTNAWDRLRVGRCRYGVMLDENGMVFDDGVTARLDDERYLMFTTTAGAAAVFEWLERWLQTEWTGLRVYLTSVSEQLANIAVAGPRARELLASVCEGIDFDRDAFPHMSFRTGRLAGLPVRVLRISFSGELSYEINLPADRAPAVWEMLIDAGSALGITPYGTETLRVLRGEKGHFLVGQDTDGSVTPVDLGLGRMLARRKDFLGKRSLTRPAMLRPDRKQFVGLLTDRPDEVLPEGAQIVDDPRASAPVPISGHVTSSYMSPTLDRSIALALVKGGRDRMGRRVHVPLLDGRVIDATIASPVFFDPHGERLHV